MIQIRISTSLLLLISTAALGCSGARRTTQNLQPSDPCAIDAGTAASMVRVAVMGPVDPQHAPVPSNDSERLLFRQLYQTLVSTDCHGNVIPELAESWSSSEDGRIWVFRLRTDAKFWDGTPVTPHEVMRSWSEHGFAAAVTGLRAAGERELRVELRTATSHVSLFANPDFAVARHDPTTNWPIGSGAFRVDGAPTQRVVRMTAHDRVLEFHMMSGTDPRAALDAGMDALITSDAATLDYARALPGYAITPLAWNRTYVLVTARTQSPDTVLNAEALHSFVRGAVRGETRPAQSPFAWQDPVCPAHHERGMVSRKTNAVMYPSNDPIAQSIAERFVALAWPFARAPIWLRALLPAGYGNASPPTALSRKEPALTQSLSAHEALGFVVPLPRSTTCTYPVPMALAEASALGLRITPILDARDQLIHRGTIGGLVLTSDGVFRFDGGAR